MNERYPGFLIHERADIAPPVLEAGLELEQAQPWAFTRFESMLGIVKSVPPSVELRRNADNLALYSPLKELGIFDVLYTEADYSFKFPSAGLQVKRGDPCLELHLGTPIAKEDRSVKAVADSLSLTAAYISLHDLQFKYVIGLTHERMALFAARQFGFHGIYPRSYKLPGRVHSGLQRISKDISMRGHDSSKQLRAAVVYMSKDEFLDKFSNE